MASGEEVDLSRVIARAWTAIKSLVRKGVTLESRVDPGPDRIQTDLGWSDPGQPLGERHTLAKERSIIVWCLAREQRGSLIMLDTGEGIHKASWAQSWRNSCALSLGTGTKGQGWPFPLPAS
jgi:hypothetical protein